MKTTKDHRMYCQVCGKPFDCRNTEQVLYHETECEPEEIILPDDAHYARLEDEMYSYMPRFEFVKHAEPLSFDTVLKLINQVTSSL